MAMNMNMNLSNPSPNPYSHSHSHSHSNPNPNPNPNPYPYSNPYPHPPGRAVSSQSGGRSPRIDMFNMDPGAPFVAGVQEVEAEAEVEAETERRRRRRSVDADSESTFVTDGQRSKSSMRSKGKGREIVNRIRDTLHPNTNTRIGSGSFEDGNEPRGEYGLGAPVPRVVYAEDNLGYGHAQGHGHGYRQGRGYGHGSGYYDPRYDYEYDSEYGYGESDYSMDGGYVIPPSAERVSTHSHSQPRSRSRSQSHSHSQPRSQSHSQIHTQSHRTSTTPSTTTTVIPNLPNQWSPQMQNPSNNSGGWVDEPELERTSDYARMSMEGTDNNVSWKRVKGFLKTIEELPWVAKERVTVDYYP